MIFNIEYYSVRHTEIDQIIAYLENMSIDCQLKINRLKSMKSERERLDKRQKDLNDIAQHFSDHDLFSNLDDKTKIEIIRQHMGSTYTDATRLLPLILRYARHTKKKSRSALLAQLYAENLPVAHIANRLGISRQAVHTLIKKDRLKR